jgi:hypothetical protein
MIGRIISKTTGGAEQDHYWMLSTIYKNGAEKLRFRLKTNGRTTTLTANSGVIRTGEWVHAAAVYDGSRMRLYQNGVEVGATRKTGSVAVGATVPVLIGNNPGSGRPFDGLIDEMRIYSRALTAREISELIAAQTSGL